MLSNEGGYVDNPHDPGGETYMGVARKKWPNWEGWDRIDLYKVNSNAFPEVLERDAAIKGYVKDFYRTNFWLKVMGDRLDNQDLATFLFDTAVHLGPPRAVLFLQQALNVLNERQKLYADISEDGAMGAQTMAAVLNYKQHRPPNYLRKTLIILRGAYYIERVQQREESEIFLRGWLNRLKLR